MFSAPSCWQYIHIAGIQINREIEKRHMGEVNKCLLTLSLNGLWYLDFLIQIQDALRHITTIPLEQRFMEKLDQNWPRWWRLKEERVLSSNHFWTSWLRFVVLVQLLACYLCGEIQTQSKVLEVGPSPSKLGGGGGKDGRTDSPYSDTLKLLSPTSKFVLGLKYTNKWYIHSFLMYSMKWYKAVHFNTF